MMPEQKHIAILDMNNGVENQGIRCIKDIVSRDYEGLDLTYDLFDVRQSGKLPDMSYDLYISSGGPGSPIVHKDEFPWVSQVADLIDGILDYNQRHRDKKSMLLICYSFQLVVHLLGIAKVRKRKSTSFGITSIYKTPDGKNDPLYKDLPNPFYVADFRDYQVVQPDRDKMEKEGMNVLSLEKIRPYVALERAITGIRLTPEIVGVQYHPEADPDSLKDHFEKEEHKQKIVNAHGLAKYERIMERLFKNKVLDHTHNTIIPNFIRSSAG